MKIGILAFQQAVNYGATLQIYALQKVIKDIKPKNTKVEVLNYEQPILEKENRTIRFKSNLFKDMIRNVLYFRQRSLRKKRFKEFYGKHINLTKKYKNLDSLESFSTVIVGSDQVWNSDIHDYDTTYLLNTDSDIKKISYAASIGKDKLSSCDQENFRRYLPEFSAVSVRENNGVDLISDYTDQNINVTLDPTLLLTEAEWKQIIPKKKSREKYILVYQLQANEDLDKIAKEVSELLNLPLKYVIPQHTGITNRISTEYTYGPEEFLSLIDNSEFIITNSFHGTCFSVIFNKQFITVPHKTRGTRMIDLLENLKLEDRIMYKQTELDDSRVMKKTNFEEANSILTELVKESKEYLIKNL